jgi:hypothetical protein
MHFSNAKIYKIVSDLTDKIYIGSTCSPLNKRLYQHKTIYNRSKSIEIIKLGDSRIELIEEFPCSRREELNVREGYHIKLNKDICVNKCIAGRTLKEYYNDNKEQIIEKQTQYNQANKDIICKYQKEYQKGYKELHKDKLKEYRKEYYNTHKDKIAEYYQSKKQLKNLTIL